MLAGMPGCGEGASKTAQTREIDTYCEIQKSVSAARSKQGTCKSGFESLMGGESDKEPHRWNKGLALSAAEDHEFGLTSTHGR